MATNYIQDGNVLSLSISGKSSGDPICVGKITGVALNNTDSSGKVRVCTKGVFDLSVKAIDSSGNSAVAVGDAIYYVAADTPKLNKKDTGVLFGYALEAISAGNTDTIKVLLK